MAIVSRPFRLETDNEYHLKTAFHLNTESRLKTPRFSKILRHLKAKCSVAHGTSKILT